MAFTWHVSPFPSHVYVGICNKCCVRQSWHGGWGFTVTMYTIYLQYRQCFGVPWFQMLISKLAEEDPWGSVLCSIWPEAPQHARIGRGIIENQHGVIKKYGACWLNCSFSTRGCSRILADPLFARLPSYTF